MNVQSGFPIKEGYVYHIDDAYFQIANDSFLMKNKESGHSRPTYYCFKDPATALLWCVPLSTQVEKYQKYIEKSVQKRGECLGIYIGEYDNKPNAFLIQNMFPITEKYINHVHSRNGQPLPVSHKVQKEVESRLKRVLMISRKGKKVVFPDIMRLEQMMLNELPPQKKIAVANSTGHAIAKSDYLIEIKRPDQLAALQASGIPFQKAETSDGTIIVKVKLEHKEAAKSAIQNAQNGLKR